MIHFIRSKFKLVCLVCFLLTSGAGLLGLLLPGVVDTMAGTTIDINEQTAFFAQTAFLLVTLIGFWFLVIMIDPEGQKPLIGLAISEKFIFVGFLIYAMGPLKLSWMFMPVVIGDLAMGLVLLTYLVLGPAEDAI